MKIVVGFQMLETNNLESCSMYSTKCMWYNYLNEYLLIYVYIYNSICPCMFNKKSTTRF